VRRVAPGGYTWLPLGLRVLRNIERVVREEMDAMGAQEIQFPALLPREPYETTGRWTEYGDLIFRLKDVVLALPPLRTRGEDIWRLVRAFLRQYAPAGRPEPIVTAAARRLLEGYAWPGNVRELQREIHRAVVLSGGPIIGPEHLSLRVEAPRTAARSLKDAVRACEQEHIAAVLGEHGGNRARAAVALGLTRQGLVAKIGRLGIG